MISLSLCLSLFCADIVKTQASTLQKSRIEVCEDITHEAITQNVDPILAVAVAWRESAFIRTASSNKGAVGPMQVIPRFWCREKPCDYIEAGVRALKYYTKRYGVEHGLCAYFSGKPCSSSTRAANQYRLRVLKTATSFRRIYLRTCEGC